MTPNNIFYHFLGILNLSLFLPLIPLVLIFLFFSCSVVLSFFYFFFISFS